MEVMLRMVEEARTPAIRWTPRRFADRTGGIREVVETQVEAGAAPPAYRRGHRVPRGAHARERDLLWSAARTRSAPWAAFSPSLLRAGRVVPRTRMRTASVQSPAWPGEARSDH